MRYLGGKYRIRKWVAETIGAHRAPGQTIWEPFCGGLNSAEAHGGPVICSDTDVALISLYRGWQQGWRPPAVVTESDYRAARLLPETDPLHGFCAFGCAFGGMKWHGYASTPGRNYAAGSARALARQVPLMAGFFQADFLALEPGPTSALLYLDPPYRGTSGYAHGFDHDLFASRVLSWAQHTTVLVSEYEFPIGELIAECVRNAELQGAAKTHTERIYLLDRNTCRAKP